MSSFLQPPPSDRDEKPPAKRITDWQDMIGRTIRDVIESPSGKRGRGFDVAIIFDDDCWTLIDAESGGEENSYARVDADNDAAYGTKHTIADYLSPKELLGAQLVNQGQYEYLVAQQQREQAEENARRAALLRAQADRLEGKKPA